MSKKPWVYAVILVAAGVLLGWFGKGYASSNMPLPGSEEDPLVTRAYVDSKFKMTVVELTPGNVLRGYAGTEIILRAGNAIVIDSELGGLCDSTQGVDLRGDNEVPRNHLLIVPRDDGRGIRAKSQIVVMVRGKFDIE